MQPPSLPWPEAHELIRDNTPLVALSETAREMPGAFCKSAEIMLRGSRVWSAALAGVSWMTFEDAIDTVRAGLSCTSIKSVMDLERDLAPRLLVDAVDRFRLLVIMATQIGEEAGYPLRCCLVSGSEKLAPPRSRLSPSLA